MITTPSPKTLLATGGCAALALGSMMIPASSNASGSGSVSFTTAGSTTWEVPAGVTLVDMYVEGGGGGATTKKGGSGAHITLSDVGVIPGNDVTITVGGGGGGSSKAGGGGGSTNLSWVGTGGAVTLVAGGGGGASSNLVYTNQVGGDAGANASGAGSSGGGSTGGAGGAGGVGGAGGSSGGVAGSDGTGGPGAASKGGDGTAGSSSGTGAGGTGTNDRSGAGGGGYGGAGGGGTGTFSANGGGGGGGSLVPTGGAITIAGNGGTSAGDGEVGTVTISWAIADQTITFPALSEPNKPEGSQELLASASSGLAVSYESNSPSVCTVSGDEVSWFAPGTCSVTANQAGNAGFDPAPPVTRTFEVKEETPTTVKARNKSKQVKPFKKTKLVKSVTVDGTVKKAKVHCLLKGEVLKGAAKRANCSTNVKIKNANSNAKITAKAFCSVGLKLRAKVVTDNASSVKSTWQRTWKVKNAPRTACIQNGNG